MAMTMEKAEKAKLLAYKKPLVKELNFDYISTRVSEISEKCDDVRYLSDNENELISMAFDDEDEEYRFKMMFSDLESDAARLNEQLYEAYVPDCFDDWFCAMECGGDYGGYMGYDSYESDLISLEYEWIVEKDAGKRIARLSKADIINSARQCFKIFTAWQSIEIRYNQIECALNTVLEKGTSVLKDIKGLAELYDKLMSEQVWIERNKIERQFDKMAQSLPDEVWLQ